MIADPSKTYVFRFTDTKGNQRWSTPKKISQCNSMNMDWNTLDEMAMFIAQFYFPYKEQIASYEAFELPNQPVEFSTL